MVKERCNERFVTILACAILLGSAVLWADRPPTNERTDFSVTYIGSRMIYLGLGAKLYDLAEQRKLKTALLPDSDPLIYEHPPFEALLLAPLGALPYKTAYLIWGLSNVCIWLVLPYLLRPYAPIPRDDLAYSVLWLLFVPLGVTLLQGQSSLVLLLVYSLTFIRLKQGHDFGAGLFIGLGLFKFQFIFPLVLIFLLLRKWHFVHGFFATGVGLVVLSLMAVGWRGVWSYVRLLATIAAHPDDPSFGAAVGMATIQGFFQALLGRVFGRAAITGLAVMLSAALIFWTALKSRKMCSTRGAAFDLMFAACIVVSLVTGFHMFTYDLSPLLLAMLLVAGNLSDRKESRWRWLLGIALVLLWVPPIHFALLAWHRVYFWFPILVVFVIGSIELANDRLTVEGYGIGD